MGTETWTVAEAKAKFSEVIDRARAEGPQIITRNGRPAVVVVASEEWERKTKRVGNLAEFFAASPDRLRLGVARSRRGFASREESPALGRSLPVTRIHGRTHCAASLNQSGLCPIQQSSSILIESCIEWARKLTGANMITSKIRTFVLTLTLFCLTGSAWASTWTWWRIPHLAFGGGYTCYLTIRDPQAVASRSIYVYLYDESGSLLAANVDGGIGATNTNSNSSLAPYYGSSFYFTLSASQEKTFAITGTGGVKTGSVQITGDGIGNISSSLRFTVTDSSGVATDVVGILPAEPNFNWTISVEKRSATDYTGIAIANPWSSSQTVTVDFYQNGSRVPGTVSRTFTLPALGHMAKFVHEDLLFGGVWNSFNGIGTLRISSTSTVSAIALRGDGTQYSSLPADAGVQNWSVSYTGAVPPVTWTWRMFDGYHFIGFEQNQEAPNQATQVARMRGVVASDLSPTMFVADWIYSSTDGSVQGMIIFQGVLSNNGNTITGTRTDIDKVGTRKAQVTFTATRVF